MPQLDPGFVMHRDVVRAGSALAATPRLARLRCQGHNEQLAPRLSQFSRLT